MKDSKMPQAIISLIRHVIVLLSGAAMGACQGGKVEYVSQQENGNVVKSSNVSSECQGPSGAVKTKSRLALLDGDHIHDSTTGVGPSGSEASKPADCKKPIPQPTTKPNCDDHIHLRAGNTDSASISAIDLELLDGDHDHDNMSDNNNAGPGVMSPNSSGTNSDCIKQASSQNSNSPQTKPSTQPKPTQITPKLAVKDDHG